MFNYTYSDAVLPSLTFTKAELVYALSVLMADIPPTDNSTRLELVEIRHYLNQIKDRIALALTDGTIARAMASSKGKPDKDIPPKPQEPTMPSMSELKAQFPSLSEAEIKEVLAQARADRLKREEEERKKAPPPQPSFIAKHTTEEEMLAAQRPPLTAELLKDKENSQKFAQMLGSF